MKVNTHVTKRPWDKEKKYTKGSLFKTDYWTVEISYKQHTPASFIIFLNRYTESFKDLNFEELTELPEVMSLIENAINAHPSLKPNKFNYLQLGNKIRYFHIHGIPRYENPIQFISKTWVDTTFGKPPLWQTVEASDDEVIKIKSELQQYL